MEALTEAERKLKDAFVRGEDQDVSCREAMIWASFPLPWFRSLPFDPCSTAFY